MADLHGPDAEDGADELAELRALAGSLPTGALEPGEVSWEQPPAGLWDRIAAEAGVTPAEPSAPAEVPRLADRASRARSRGGDGAPRTPWLLAAAAAVAALVVASAVWLGGSEDPAVVASSTLELLGTSGQGSVELVESDGSMQLRLETDGLEAGDGFIEVWVIDPEVSKLVSLGPLRADGVYDLPDGLDPTAFPIVDVSYEPLDGDPAHSGDSVLRGQLEF